MGQVRGRTLEERSAANNLRAEAVREIWTEGDGIEKSRILETKNERDMCAIRNRQHALPVFRYLLLIAAIAIGKKIGHGFYVRVTSVIQATQSESGFQ